MSLRNVLVALLCAALGGCELLSGLSDLGITPSANADAGSSYQNAKTDVWIAYSSLPRPDGSGLGDAIAYLDADGDGDTDVFLGTGLALIHGEVDSEMYISDGGGGFSLDQSVFGGSAPPATHARKSVVADFDSDGLEDLLVFDHGFDSNPFPGSQPKLIMQDSPGSFSWSKLPDTGFHHGGAAADIDNDGDIDVFVGGFEPFFYINDGSAGFSRVDDRFDGSIAKVFTAELIDVDRDGFVDLMVGAHERDGDQTSIYWGSSTGSYDASLRTIIAASPPFGAVIDIDAEDIDQDGDRDLVVNRTRDGDDGQGMGFYVGRRTQLVLQDGNRGFTDGTVRIDAPGTDFDPWFPWIRIQDVDNDGDLDIAPDNQEVGYVYLNDGSGVFTKSSLPLPN